ncbi:MAG: hypothetical protein RhofKO_00030 [Rhodothermales bacterium]
MNRLLCLVALLWATPFSLTAQTLSTEQTPPQDRWLKISTRHFNVIFPKGLDDEAQRTANTLEHLYARAAESLNTRPKHLPVVLVNQNVDANGFVALAPRRTVWFSTPDFPGRSSLIGTGEWYNLLAVHEYRHVAQFSALNRGLVRVGGFLGGETARQLLSFMTTPAWFFEGDAVGMETVLSRSGRGRLPSFDMHIRALLIDDIRYPYYKALHRSFRDYYPSHYQLGYALTTHAKRHHGADVWANVLKRSSYFPFIFSGSLRKFTGLTTTQNYDASMDELQALWTAQRERLTITPVQSHTPRDNRTWTNYVHPHFESDGSVVAVKYGHSHAPTLVRLMQDGQQTHIRPIEREAAEAMSVAAGRLAFSEAEPHPRFGYQSTSEAVVNALVPGTDLLATAGAKLFIPELSPDGSQIAAVEFNEQRKSSLVIMDVATGQETARHPSNEWISGLAWMPDQQHIAYIHSGNSTGKALSLMHVESGHSEVLLAHQHIDISNPTTTPGYVVYQTPYTGIDNIFAIDVQTKIPYQVTSRPVGAFMPDISADGTQLVFSDYTVLGYDVVTMPFDPSQWKPLAQVERDQVVYIDTLITEESAATLDEANIPSETYEVSPYRRASQALRFHSWSVAADDDEIGLQIISTNLLNTLAVGIGPSYDRQLETWRGELNLEYARFFPILTLDASFGERAAVRELDGQRERLDWTQTNVEIGVRVPLTIPVGVFTHRLSFASEIGYTQVNGIELFNDATTFSPLQHSFSAYRVQDTAPRDITPRNLQLISVAYQHAPFESGDVGHKMYGRLRFGLPGIGLHHGLAIIVEAERNTTGGLFASDATMPRGYDFVTYSDFLRGSVNYAFPIVYPDLGFRDFFALKRISGVLFFDIAGTSINTDDLRTPDVTNTPSSAGIELIGDWGALEIILPLKLGFRLAYRFEDNTIQPEITLGEIGL